jgi:hypothetical protein
MNKQGGEKSPPLFFASKRITLRLRDSIKIKKPRSNPGLLEWLFKIFFSV